jgi:DNA repair exonuclease SbcCD nuclease subunit
LPCFPSFTIPKVKNIVIVVRILNMAETLKIVHFSDVHLGASFAGTIKKRPEKRRLAQEILLTAFKEAIKIAFERKPEAVIIAGDLFDNNEPRKKIETEVYDLLAKAAAENPETYLLILPGGHDHLSYSSPYLRSPLKDLENFVNVKLFNAEGPQSVALRGKKAVFHAFPHSTRATSRRILSSLKPDPEATFNIALAHGSVEDFVTQTSDPISIEEMQLFDYTVLGHWHRFLEIRSEQKILGAYPGSLSPLEFGDVEARGLVEVKLEKDGFKTSVEVTLLKSPSPLVVLNLKANSLEELDEKLASLPEDKFYLANISLNFCVETDEVLKRIHKFPTVLEARISVKEEPKIEYSFDENDYRHHLLKAITARGEKQVKEFIDTQAAVSVIEMAKKFALLVLEGQDPIDLDDYTLED